MGSSGINPVHPAPYAPVHPPPYEPAPAHHGYCDPKAPPKCAEGSDLPYCVVDKEYPAYDIANKISQDALFLKKYADVADQSADDLVQDIAKPQEEAFDYKYYTGASKGPSPYDASHWIGPEGYLVLLMLTTPRLLVLSMLKDTGESSSNTSQRDMDTVTITIPKPLVLRPVFSPTLPVVSLP